MNFLLDTSVISEVMKPKPNRFVDAWFSCLDYFALSTVSVEETYYGLTYKDAHKKRIWFEDLLESQIELLPVSLEIAQYAGIFRAHFRRRGIIRSQPDMLIAATAYQHELVLATRNTRDFEACGIEVFNPFEE